MPSSSVAVVGADAVGKTSFVLALGAEEVATNTQLQRPRHYLWPRPGGTGHKETPVRILRSREEVSNSGDDGVVVLLFNLTRRDSLAAVIAQWAHLSDAPGRRLLLVGTHADCTSKRDVSPSEVREIAGEFHGYEEVCCRPGHSGGEGMLRVQLTLAQWTAGGRAVMVSDVPLARASICGGFPRPVVTMVMSSSSHSLPASPAGQRRPPMRADVWLYDPTEEGSSGPVAAGVGSDVKLRTISKAIYDIRGAVAEKSKALAKYRDRQMSHWLTRSRYFGPTESSRHKRWQEEQKKRQQAQGHVHHHHHVGQMRTQSKAPEVLQQQRERSVSHPDKFEPPSRKPTARRGQAHLSSSSSSENEESPGTPLERKSFMQPTELTKQRQRQLEADNAQQHKKRLAAQRVLRKQRRAASNDIFERSTTLPTAFDSYLNCYDEMDMPPQLQPLSPSLDRRTPLSIPSPASSVASSSSRKSFAGEHKAFEVEALASAGVRQFFELQSPGAEPVGCLPTPLPTTYLQSPVPPIMSPPAPSTRPLSVRSRQSGDDATLDSPQYDFLSDTVLKLDTPEKPQTEAKSYVPSPATATNDAAPKPTPPTPATPPDDLAISRKNTMCSSSSENFDCSDIDDMLEYFEGVTLPI
ncbi:hypothetical protein PHYPSEUDO_007532 [Phytophthora pseudosyringae]|uniref:P-loop containing nucleoside triphosphate hydrolase n=1 Tax=Phytophthora pseudosyringae TaxID=221518 RepID=A0A8T1W9B9_9STRA|nr:hypothetical protein PHYPSEUDO_007532 [Phytophthora pseudosyringae]